jgi:hypothetical protein
VPEVLQCKRLGHRLHGVREIYSCADQARVERPRPDGQGAFREGDAAQCGDTAYVQSGQEHAQPDRSRLEGTRPVNGVA